MEEILTTANEFCPVQIPIQMMSITDRDGKLTPI